MKTTVISILLLALLSGCTSRYNNPERAPIVHKQTTQTAQKSLPAAPKKHIKLKEVDDANLDDKYMYPEDTVKKETAETPVKQISTADNSTIPTPVTSSGAMTKEECISMISQAKFDKYSQMFGNENASIKRCAMLKAMNK